jgi:hypothetical protein
MKPAISRIVAVALAFAVLTLLSGCRSLELTKDGFTARYTNVGFDTSIGTLKIERAPDGGVIVEAGDVNSTAGVARAIAEGVAAGLK